MSALQMDFSTSSTRFQRLNSQSAKLSGSTPSFPTTEEVAIDYSKSSNRMSPEGRNPLASPTSVRVPTKGMRKAYPEDQFTPSQTCQDNDQSKPKLQQHPPPTRSTTASLDLPGKMEHSLYSHPSLHYPPGNNDHSPVSSYYPTPPPPHYNEHHLNRYNYNYEQNPNEETIREYQCLKCGLIFSRESDLHIHYAQDHGYGLGTNNGGGGNSAGGGSSTSSSSSGSSNLHLLNRANQQQNNQQRNSNQQDMFCDKCQLRFHCLLSFRVHQHEHVLPNVQPHYPMSNSHLLSLSYSCEICGANFMSRESLTDHANAHLYEHVCSESTCGESDGATNSSEDFYQRAAGHLQQSLQQFQRGYLEMENEDHSPISHHLSSPHNDYQTQHHHGHGHDNYEHQPGQKAEDSNMIVNQGPNIYSPEYSTQQYHHHSTPPEISPPVTSSKTSAGGIYEPLIVMDNGKRRFQCVICKKYLSSRIAHEEHTRGKHTGDKPYSCSYCGKRFAVWNTYKHHVGTHKGGGSAAPLQKCSLCEKKFKTIECLRNHVQREHNNTGGGETLGQDSTEGSEGNGGGYSCNLCGKTFVRKMWRTRHYLSHAGQNCFRCELCSCILPDEQSYRMHHESHKVSN